MSGVTVTLIFMNPYILLIIGLVAGGVAGFFIAKAGAKGAATTDNSAQLAQDLAVEKNTSRLLNDQIQSLNLQLAQHQERERQDKEAESKVLQALTPVQDRIKEMKEKVEALDKERTEQFTTISEQLRTQQLAEAKLRDTTAALANALTNNQTRGGWGESRLEEIVIQAGLTKGLHYDTQFDTVNDEGVKIRPDMVIMLPEGKTVAVDSKTPYQNYLRAMEEKEKGIEANKDLVKNYLAQHAKDVKAKIADLGKKNYWSGLSGSPEFTLLFIPNEPVLAATLETDSSIMEYAFSNRVALVSPVSFFSVLKTIAYTWRKSADEQTIDQVIDLGVSIYKEIRIMAEKAVKLGGHIDNVVDDFNGFMGNLDGKFLKPTRDLNARALGRLGDKEIPEAKLLEERTKRPVQPELISDLPKELPAQNDTPTSDDE
jgi:DNA recombination protein RmuC